MWTLPWLELTAMSFFLTWLYVYGQPMLFSIQKNQGPMACIDVMRLVQEGELYWTLTLYYHIHLSIIYFTYSCRCTYETDALILYVTLPWILPKNGVLSLKHMGCFKFTTTYNFVVGIYWCIWIFCNVFRCLPLGNAFGTLSHKRNMDKLKIDLLLNITIKIGSILHIRFVAEIYVLFPRSAENGRLKGRRCLSVSPLIHMFYHRNISSISVKYGVKYIYYSLKRKLKLRCVGTKLLTLSMKLKIIFHSTTFFKSKYRVRMRETGVINTYTLQYRGFVVVIINSIKNRSIILHFNSVYNKRCHIWHPQVRKFAHYRNFPDMSQCT